MILIQFINILPLIFASLQIASSPLAPEKLCQKKKKTQKTYDLAFNAMLRITSPMAGIAMLQNPNKVWNSSEYISLDTLNHQDPRYNSFTEEQILQHCLNFFANETAKVTIEFLDTDVMQVQRDSRFTIMDQFGIIGNKQFYHTLCSNSTNIPISGGAVGLFTGFSIISIIEMVFWIFKAFDRMMHYKKKRY